MSHERREVPDKPGETAVRISSVRGEHMGWSYDTSDIDRMIEEFLPERGGFQKTVTDAMNDAVEAGGKRVRPILMYETYRMFAGDAADEAEIAPFMAAMEMMHTSSLIHDDLPCMDNDTLRRGKPTTWVLYGDDMATLAGDALMIETFYTCAHAALEGADPVRGLKAIEILADKSGIRGMVGGQTLDVEKTGQSLTHEELEFIYTLKTGALLEASMMIGAVLGGADEKELRTVERIAADIGMAFQIQDDILDETASQEALGKNIHSDAEHGKSTYVSLYGVDRAHEAVVSCSREAETLTQELAQSLRQRIPGADGTRLVQIIHALTDRDR